jgi:hypothetical protein
MCEKWDSVVRKSLIDKSARELYESLQKLDDPTPEELQLLSILDAKLNIKTLQ